MKPYVVNYAEAFPLNHSIQNIVSNTRKTRSIEDSDLEQKQILKDKTKITETIEPNDMEVIYIK